MCVICYSKLSIFCTYSRYRTYKEIVGGPIPHLGIFLACMYTKRKEFGNPISTTNLAMYLYVPDLAYVLLDIASKLDLRAIWFRSSFSIFWSCVLKNFIIIDKSTIVPFKKDKAPVTMGDLRSVLGNKWPFRTSLYCQVTSTIDFFYCGLTVSNCEPIVNHWPYYYRLAFCLLSSCGFSCFASISTN